MKINKIVLFCMMLLVVSSVSAYEAKFLVGEDVVPLLTLGESTSVSVCSEDIYDITALTIGHEYSKFVVNGDVSDSLQVGESDIISGFEVTLLEVYRESKAKFVVNGDVSDFLMEGESDVLASQEFSVLVVGHEEVTVLVNGDVSDSLHVGESDIISGFEVTLLEIEKSDSEAKVTVAGEIFTLVEGKSLKKEFESCNNLEFTFIEYEDKQVKVVLNGDVSDSLHVGESDIISEVHVTFLELYEPIPIVDPVIFDQATSDDIMEDSDKPSEVEVHTTTAVEAYAGDSTPDQIIEQEVLECSSGCLLDDRCYDTGVRLETADTSVYCSPTGTFESQKEKQVSCQNDFECGTNQCIDGVCKSLSEELEETRGALSKFFNWFSNIFS
jgi:hypothetical protein